MWVVVIFGEEEEELQAADDEEEKASQCVMEDGHEKAKASHHKKVFNWQDEQKSTSTRLKYVRRGTKRQCSSNLAYVSHVHHTHPPSTQIFNTHSTWPSLYFPYICGASHYSATYSNALHFVIASASCGKFLTSLHHLTIALDLSLSRSASIPRPRLFSLPFRLTHSPLPACLLALSLCVHLTLCLTGCSFF